MQVAQFFGLVVAAYAAGFLSMNVTSVLLTTMFIPRGQGRVIVNAELFRLIWSWGINQPGIQFGTVIAAVIIGALCLACATMLSAFATAGAIAGALGFIAMLVMFFTL